MFSWEYPKSQVVLNSVSGNTNNILYAYKSFKIIAKAYIWDSDITQRYKTEVGSVEHNLFLSCYYYGPLL